MAEMRIGFVSRVIRWEEGGGLGWRWGGGYPLSRDLFRVGAGREGKTIVPGAGVDEVMKKGEESEEKARGLIVIGGG